MAEAEAFLDKAQESLGSAEDDYDKGRYNSCARSLYYAAFQAAVAALLAEGIRPRGRWEHEFVHARFAGVLVRSRKAYSAGFAALLPKAFQLRGEADYSATPVAARRAGRILEDTRDLVRAVKESVSGDR